MLERENKQFACVLERDTHTRLREREQTVCAPEGVRTREGMRASEEKRAHARGKERFGESLPI